MSVSSDTIVLTSPRLRAQLPGREVAYRHSKSTGVPVVLIHGVGSNCDVWDGVFERLAQSGANVVALDLPGHGQSTKQRGDYSLGSMANSVRDLMDYLDINTALLVGHSLGGGIAMQTYYQFPNRVNGLVLASSGGLGEETRQWLKLATLPGTEIVLSALGSRATVSSAAWVGRRLSRLGARPRILADDALARFREFGDREYRNAFLATLRSVVDISGQRVSGLPSLRVAKNLPVLFIWGDDDATIPMHHGENAARDIPDSRFVIFDNAGHEPHVNDPKRFAEEVLAFAEANSA